MAEKSIEEAQALLRRRPEYDWLFTGPLKYSVTELTERLNASGLDVSIDTVRRRVKEWPLTEDFGVQFGLRAHRDDVMRWLAAAQRGQQRENQAG